MVGYAEPCPFCGNNKRRRYVPHVSRSDDGPVTRSTLPVPSPPGPKASSAPSLLEAAPSSPASEKTPGDAIDQDGSPPPAAATAGAAAAAAAGEPGCSSPPPSPPKTPQSSRPVTNSAHLMNCTGDTSPTPDPPALAATKTAAATLKAFPPEESEAASVKNGEGMSGKKGGTRRARPATVEDGNEGEEVAAIRIKCKCGSMQEFMYRQTMA